MESFHSKLSDLNSLLDTLKESGIGNTNQRNEGGLNASMPPKANGQSRTRSVKRTSSRASSRPGGSPPKTRIVPEVNGQEKDLKDLTLKYSNGEIAVQLDKKGTGQFCYPSGAVAVSLSPVSDGIYTTIFEDAGGEDGQENKKKNGKKDKRMFTLHPLSGGSIFNKKNGEMVKTGAMLASIDSHGRGTVLFPAGMGSRVRLLLSPRGGKTFTQDGVLSKEWKWTEDGMEEIPIVDVFGSIGNTQNSSSASKGMSGPMLSPVEVSVNSLISLKIAGNDSISLKFQSQGVSILLPIGYVPAKRENYLDKVVAKDLSRGGKLIMNVNSKYSEPSKKQIAKIPTASDLNKRKDVNFSNSGSYSQFNDLANTIRSETSTWKLKSSVSSPKKRLDSSSKYSTDFNMTTQSEFNASFNTEDLGSTQNSIRSLPAISQSRTSTPLAVSRSLRHNSGKYRGITSESKPRRTPKKKLREVRPEEFDDFIKTKVDKNKLLVVGCFANWIPKSRRSEQMMEEVNGLLELGSEEGAENTVSSQADKPLIMLKEKLDPKNFQLVRFDVCSGDFMRIRYAIKEASAPVFLMFYGGELVYAAPHLKNFGLRRQDLIDQMNESLQQAKMGRFLPSNFRFEENLSSVKTASEITAALDKTFKKLRIK